MKDNNLINYPTWFLSFNSDSKGKFVIGTLPHLYDNITYYETDMTKENCRAPCNIYKFKILASLFQKNK